MAPLIPLIAMAAGTVLSAYGQKQSGKEAAKAYEAAAVADEVATDFNFANYHKQASARLAEARALRAGSGIEMGTGSALMVDEATINEIMTQERQIKVEGKARAESLRRGGTVAQRSGNIQAGASLLSGVADFGMAGGFEMFGGGG